MMSLLSRITQRATLYERPWPRPRLEDCSFYHTIDLPQGIVTGLWDLRGQFDSYTNHVPMAGKRVLDFGTGSGFFSFEAEQRGAEVVSFDLKQGSMLDYLPSQRPPAEQIERDLRRLKAGYWYCHHALGSKAKVHYGDPFRLDPALGSFDTLLIGSVLIHCHNPIGILMGLAPRVKERMVITELTIPHKHQGCKFAADSPLTWWVWSVGVYKKLLTLLDFELERSSELTFVTNDGVERIMTSMAARRVR